MHLCLNDLPTCERTVDCNVVNNGLNDDLQAVFTRYADLFAEAVDDGADSVEVLLELADSTLVRLVTVAQLVALAFLALVRLRQLTNLALDRVQAPAHRLQCIQKQTSFKSPHF